MTTITIADVRAQASSGVQVAASGADLYGANLYGANLRGANLRGANLSGASWYGLRVDGIPSHQVTLTPTPDGWHLTIGCWAGTVQQLRDLAATDTDWPEATGDEIAARRPTLLAIADLCEAHTAYHHGVIGELAAKWADTTTPKGTR